MRIGIIGSGYVGLTTAVGLATMGNAVACVDVDAQKVRSILEGSVPFFEPGLTDALATVLSQKRFSASTDYASLFPASAVFLCVGTPSLPDGSLDEQYLQTAIRQLAPLVCQQTQYFVLVVKSTVLPGTTAKLASLLETLSGKKAGVDFGVCMNPEFLREGRALDDFMHPDRIVLGSTDAKAVDVLKQLYLSLAAPTLVTDAKTAEMIKYGSNAFLAAKISFINELGHVCKASGIDVYDVARGMGMDPRIGPQFLDAGCGFGGSCFPKDVRALVAHGRLKNVPVPMLESTLEVNALQPARLVALCTDDLKNKTVAVLGLAFKPDSDDVRESPAFAVVDALAKRGAHVVAYDPKASENFRKQVPAIAYASSAPKAVADATHVFIVTAWPQFNDPQLYCGKKVYAGRKVLGPSPSFEYHGLDW